MSTNDHKEKPHEMAGQAFFVRELRSGGGPPGEQGNAFGPNNDCHADAQASTATPCRPMLRITAGGARSHQSGAETPRRTRTTSKTLGQVLKRRRHELGLTQRDLAAKIGVKPAHIAYLELDRRRPSLTLLGRIADVLKLERESLFALSHPEAKTFIGAQRKARAARSKDRVWRDFKNDRQMLTGHDVSGEELKLLSQVNLLGKITAPRNFLFILNSIREAAEEEE